MGKVPVLPIRSNPVLSVVMNGIKRPPILSSLMTREDSKVRLITTSTEGRTLPDLRIIART